MGGVRNVQSDLHRTETRSRLRATRVSKKDTGNKQKRLGSGSQAARKPLVFSGTKGEPDYEEFANVWESLGFSVQEAANLEARSMLMIQIEDIIRRNEWTQAQAAKRCGVTQPRISDLFRGNIDKFSLDALVNIAAALGQRVNMKLEAA